MNQEIKLGFSNTMTIRLDKPKKRGRPSNEDKRIYGVYHTITVPENTPQDKLFEEFQKEVEKLNLPVKLI